MQLPPQAEPHLTSWNDFCRLVLEIIEELSPCPEPTLFVVAANRGLQRFGDGSLSELSKLLDHCVKELQARALVEIKEKHFVITREPTAVAEGPEKEEILDLPAVSRSVEDEDVLDLTTVAGSAQDEDILQLTTVAGSAEDEDILELTAEFELHSPLRPAKLDEAPTNQQQLKTQAPVRGEPKRVTEPTREEIIAAMRRFVSDD